ncbi:hypothetical protein SPYCA_2982 [Sphingopyxis sp. FD7]|nr:hypothetical protein SPYCA_2982 [Sphingopyxis sp. FD7]
MRATGADQRGDPVEPQAAQLIPRRRQRLGGQVGHVRQQAPRVGKRDRRQRNLRRDARARRNGQEA